MSDQPIAEAVRDWGPAVGAFLAKWGAGIAGSVLSLRFLPTGTSKTSRAFAFGGGVLCVIYAAPAMVDVFGVDSPCRQSLIQFVTGLLGMSAAGELWSTLSQLGAARLARDWIRARLGLPPDQPPEEPPTEGPRG